MINFGNHGKDHHDLLRYSHQSFYIVGPSRQSSEENMWTPSFSKVELEKVLSSQTWSFVFSYMLYGTSVKSQGIWVNNFKIFLPLTVKKDKHSFAAVLESSKFTLNFAAKYIKIFWFFSQVNAMTSPTIVSVMGFILLKYFNSTSDIC